ncbi:MAG: hypothetical protein U0V02_17180 [Anaerolineales bacterium]
MSEKYESTDKSIYDHWLDVSKANTVITKIPPPVQNIAFISKPLQSFTDKEAWDRALRMYRLGNEPQAIQSTLKQAGVTQKAVGCDFFQTEKNCRTECSKAKRKVPDSDWVFHFDHYSSGW